LIEPLGFGNGAPPRIPVINDQTLPGFLTATSREEMRDKHDIRLRIFSGTANPSLAQVSISKIC